MRADIHDGSEHNTLQSEAGYIDARPHQPELPKPLAPHGRTIHWVKAPAIDLFNLGRLRSVPFAARLHAPELKTVRIDRALNVFARKPVRRVLRPVALMTAIE